MDYDEELDEDYSPENDHNYDEEDDDEDLEFQLEEDEPELPHDIDINDIISEISILRIVIFTKLQTRPDQYSRHDE